MIYTQQTFTSGELLLDGNEYTDCTFTDCVVVYSGGAVPILRRCKFSRVRVVVDGAAASTLATFRALYQGGGAGAQREIESKFAEVRASERPWGAPGGLAGDASSTGARSNVQPRSSETQSKMTLASITGAGRIKRMNPRITNCQVTLDPNRSDNTHVTAFRMEDAIGGVIADNCVDGVDTVADVRNSDSVEIRNNVGRARRK